MTEFKIGIEILIQHCDIEIQKFISFDAFLYAKARD